MWTIDCKSLWDSLVLKFWEWKNPDHCPHCKKK